MLRHGGSPSGVAALPPTLAINADRPKRLLSAHDQTSLKRPHIACRPRPASISATSVGGRWLLCAMKEPPPGFNRRALSVAVSCRIMQTLSECGGALREHPPADISAQRV